MGESVGRELTNIEMDAILVESSTFLSRNTYPGSIGAPFTMNRYLYG